MTPLMGALLCTTESLSRATKVTGIYFTQTGATDGPSNPCHPRSIKSHNDQIVFIRPMAVIRGLSNPEIHLNYMHVLQTIDYEKFILG